jgi:hypothetical protein
MSKPTAYDLNPGKRDRLIAAGETKYCNKCSSEVPIENYYWMKRSNMPMSCCKDCWKASRKERWHNDPTYLVQQKRWLRNNKQHVRDHMNDRYKNDEDFRERKKAAQKKYEQSEAVRIRRNERNKVRYATDPEYRQKCLDRRKAQRAKKIEDK